MYYIFQMYIPCVCIVALSWVSFWINHEAVPARVALSITTVLTISYMRGSVNAGMPRVSYLKSIDYFLLGGFVFIFMTLLEYVLVLKQSRKLHIFHEKKNDYKMTENGEEPVSCRMMIIPSFCNKPFCRALECGPSVQFCSLVVWLFYKFTNMRMCEPFPLFPCLSIFSFYKISLYPCIQTSTSKTT